MFLLSPLKRSVIPLPLSSPVVMLTNCHCLDLFVLFLKCSFTMQPCCPGTHYIDHIGLEITGICLPLSLACVLGLKVLIGTIIPNKVFLFFIVCFVLRQSLTT